MRYTDHDNYPTREPMRARRQGRKPRPVSPRPVSPMPAELAR